jgi:hypothetical protein
MRPRRRETRLVPGLGAEQEHADSRNPTPTTSAPHQPRFIVIQSKASREVVVGHYDDEKTARSVMRLLAWAGAVARIERES